MQLEWSEQYLRMLRSLRRLDAGASNTADHQDNLFHFFQDAWHLKDWILNDDSVAAVARRQIVAAVEAAEPFVIAADLANRSKHLKLTRHIRKDAEFASRNVTVTLGGAVPPAYETIVTLGDGRTFVGEALATDTARS